MSRCEAEMNLALARNSS